MKDPISELSKKSLPLINTHNTMKIGKVAATLGVPVETVRQWCKDGILKPTITHGGHRLFNTREIIEMKTKNAEFTVCVHLDYVGLASKLRKDKQEKQNMLFDNLKNFDGDNSGLELSVTNKSFRDQTSDIMRDWYLIIHEGEEIFAAIHDEGDVFEYKCYPLRKDKYKADNPLSPLGLKDKLSPYSFIEYPKISGAQKSSLNDLLMALVKQISSI